MKENFSCPGYLRQTPHTLVTPDPMCMQALQVLVTGGHSIDQSINQSVSVAAQLYHAEPWRAPDKNSKQTESITVREEYGTGESRCHPQLNRQRT